jgi:hypothetical protein
MPDPGSVGAPWSHTNCKQATWSATGSWRREAIVSCLAKAVTRHYRTGAFRPGSAFWYGALRTLRAAVIVLLIALLPAHARAEPRIALLIGNEAYGEIGRLANPHNDVAVLEGALKGLDFEVTVARDAGLGALTRAVNAYARRVQAAGPGAVGFFYYSGHGASDGSTNYLIPVDVKTAKTGALSDESLRLTEITRTL